MCGLSGSSAGTLASAPSRRPYNPRPCTIHATVECIPLSVGRRNQQVYIETWYPYPVILGSQILTTLFVLPTHRMSKLFDTLQSTPSNIGWRTQKKLLWFWSSTQPRKKLSIFIGNWISVLKRNSKPPRNPSFSGTVVQIGAALRGAACVWVTGRSRSSTSAQQEVFPFSGYVVRVIEMY